MIARPSHARSYLLSPQATTFLLPLTLFTPVFSAPLEVSAPLFFNSRFLVAQDHSTD